MTKDISRKDEMTKLAASDSKRGPNIVSRIALHTKSKHLLAVIVAGGVIATMNFHTASSTSNSLTDDLASENSGEKDFANLENFSSMYQSSHDETDGNGTVRISDNEVSVDINSDSKANVDRSHSSISVNIENKSTPANQEPPSPSEQPSLTINGQEVEIPKNGRVNETIKDETTKTRLRADVDGEGSSSIRISTETNN